MSTAAIAADAPRDTATARAWEKIGNPLVLLLYAGVVLFTVRYHEKWADEAQAWLIARDLDLKTIWFHELRYEGSPGLWHTILWIAQHVFHLPYAALGYIGVAFAIAGVAVLIYKSPFPWYVRWPLAFTYVMVYQYAVIARPYTILPLLCFLVAIFFKDVERPMRMTIVLVLLANLSLHGTLLAASFGFLYLIVAIKQWPAFDDRLRNRYFICVAVLVFMFLFVFVVLKPPGDTEEFVMKRQMAGLPEAVKEQIHMPTPQRKGSALISGAYLDYFVPSLVFVALTAAWFVTRRRPLTFLLPAGLLIALYSVVHGYPHHHGTLVIATITALWIAWPTKDELQSFRLRRRWELRGMVGLLLVFCGVNIWDATVVIKREYLYPYSGAKDAADYLKSVGAERFPMFGFVYGVAGVQAYFDHNIFANSSTTYFHHGWPLQGTQLNSDELFRVKPEYVVVYSVEPELMVKMGVVELASRGYDFVHFSDGYYLYKQAVYQRESYFIFRRVHPTSEQTPQPANPDK
jgi:hypothetical protein